ncbi:hypothetical protein TraAM80_00427 [Trypanosoma rangeli]|uniref:Uncharacterized protein n=1 Tax=Trypanosoma rangeli TaxID=5698 RepID=A0A3R7MW82_TRYRA|nr:uncharacterized protein TraAM80_00427 [Trypanosoma rangeli]RNF12279.1 hypothetical protein TraAM80_00427 [Trypanosoma rangeli]|eukprot:RNF12279.1 hypothetical protein TraAM80_00427 [Trypanosoma rangeli]
MKGLEEWLASSSTSASSEASNNAGTVSVPRVQGGHGGEVPGVTDARARHEMRERMRGLLGDSVVKAVVAETSVGGELSAPQSVSTADKNRAEGGNHTGSDQSGERHQNSNGKNSGDGTNSYTPPLSSEYCRVEVMVVDRGTQTTSTTACQTDPVEDYAPRIGYPLTACCTCSCGRRFPGERMLREEYLGEATPVRFREQLDMIKNSIDMLIARYNLPPPPLPRV